MSKAKIDITKNVMHEVSVFEKKRSSFSLLKIVVLGLSTVTLAVFLLWSAYSEAMQYQTFELLSIFREDMEIVREYWRDTLITFWEELPQGKIILGGIFLIVAMVIIIKNRKRVRLFIKRLKAVAKY